MVFEHEQDDSEMVLSGGNKEDDRLDEDDGLEELLLQELEDERDAKRAKVEKHTNIRKHTLPAQPVSSEGLEKADTKKVAASYCPPHPGYIGGICIRCGINKEEAEQDNEEQMSPKSAYFKGDAHQGRKQDHLSLKYIHHGLEVSASEAARLSEKTVRHALENRKLLLVLDLDHTLLHSTRMTDLTEEQTKQLVEMVEEQPPGAPMLYHLPHMGMWTKLRPGVRKFFEKVREMYDLHVFTMGDRNYAAGMAQLLDPTGRLFGGRVASSSDAGDTMMKDLDVLLGSDDMMVILDDTVGVWPKHRQNLIQVERYIYFPACAARFGARERCYLERNTDEDSRTGMLACCLRVLEEAHRRFFCTVDGSIASNIDKNVSKCDIRLILSEIRSTVLQGCCILFSRIIPKDADPSLHPAWLLAQDLGAKCVQFPSSEVTHVISAGLTSKTEWGHRNSKHVVTMDWLHQCGFAWRKLDEKNFTDVGNTNLAGGGMSWNDEQKSTAAALSAAGGGRP